jgi:sugar lactone lactonase YvrE
MRAQQLTFTTFAGPVGGPGSADGTGSDARFFAPAAVATDSGGNVYVADTDNHTIRKVSPTGVVTTVAGLAGVFGNLDGIGGAARFDNPKGVAIDRAGNVYVADTYNETIRKITPAGMVTTLAGSPGIVGSTDGRGSAARFSRPSGVATGSGGTVYVADTDNHTIRKITPTGTVTTVAGLAGAFGDADGTGAAARFDHPRGVAIDSGGNVYVLDGSRRGSSDSGSLRKIDTAGMVTTLADAAGRAIFFDEPAAVATDGGGNVYVTDQGKLRKITPAGVETNVSDAVGSHVASADGIRIWESFFSGVATDSGGNVYGSDTRNHLIRKITPEGVVTTMAGSASTRGSADGTGSAARFGSPEGMATDIDGNVYVADSETSSIRKITPAGVVTTLAGSRADGVRRAVSFDFPSGVATDRGGNVYVLDGPSYSHTIQKITPTGLVTTLASLPEESRIAEGGGSVYAVDADHNTIRLISPAGVGSGGNVYVAKGITIQKITPAGIVATLAGSGQDGSADGAGSDARFRGAFGVAADSSGNVYVADTFNETIRKITPEGLVTTVGSAASAAGYRQPGLRGSADGTGSVARFFLPKGVATDGTGNVYVADTNNHKIRVGRPALPDAATIDASTGAVGIKRQLNTSLQTATSWQWRVIRQPSGSAATLSSTSIRNPRFTPDVADLYIFQVTASKGEKTSITTVSLTATATAPGKR